MVQGWAVFATSVIYLLILFAVASYGDRMALKRATGSRPNIYALTLAVYCTTWTFFGSVGLASTGGLNFLAIYAGPILMVLLCHPLVERVVRLSKSERISSVADFLGSRYGKSLKVAGVAALIAVIGTVPYIALQLKAISSSVVTLVYHYELLERQNFLVFGEVSILIAATLAVFTVLFGTRHADATEHQDGLMLAVALESALKLVSFLCVGIFVTFVMFDGFGDIFEQAAAKDAAAASKILSFDPGSFAILTFLSFTVFLLLPRQFHVIVVENHSQGELKRARWLFPLYLVAINLFVAPIAAAGFVTFGDAVSADNFVLLLPTSVGNDWVSMVAFLGGLSAGTAMVVVACVALAIMISNDLVLPAYLRLQESRGRPHKAEMEQLILNIRRLAIVGLLVLAYAYVRVADNSRALASIGLVSFAAIAQLAPAFFGGLVWQGANARGAIAGMVCGFIVWTYTLLLPTILDPQHWLIATGLHSSGALRPESILDLGLSPIANGVIWSLTFNLLGFVVGSLSRLPTSNENLQSAIFVDRGQPIRIGRRATSGTITVAELIDTVSRYLGERRTQRSFNDHWKAAGAVRKPEEPADADLLRFSEQLLASAIGASSSRLVHSLLLKRFDKGVRANRDLFDEATQALKYNRDVLQTAFDQMDQGISVFDADYRLAFWNRQFRRLLTLPASFGRVGASLDEILTHLCAEQNIVGDSASPDALAERIVEHAEPWLLALAKSEKILEIRTSAMPGGGVVVTWNDITDRILVSEALREANETLEKRVEERTSELLRANQDLEKATRTADQANASKTRFLAAAGHDILQPLNAARLYSSALIERISDHSEARLAGSIQKSLESVEDILSALLAIARLDTDRIETRVAAFALQPMLDQLLIEFSPVAQEKGLDLRFVRTSLWVQSDPSLLRRMVQNLLSNAIKYTPKGKVLAGCRRQGDQVVIEVIDTGIGIDEAETSSVFVEFRRLEAGKKQAAGLGLGLSIVERLGKMLGHRVTLKSRPGHGTRFSVAAPRAQPVELARPARVASSTVKPKQRFDGITALCIDNDLTILDGMATLLGNWGCKVVTAADEAGAMEAIAHLGRMPEFVFADYHLDHGDGIGAIKAIREQHGLAFTAVLVTADRTQAVKHQADELGIVTLHKPVRPAALRAIMSNGATRREAAE